MMKVFKPIPGHAGYEVSDQGTVRSLDRIIERNGKPARLCGRTLSLRRHTQGYKAVSLGNGKQATVHSLVMLAFEGPRPHGAWINHINGDKTDNRLINLEYCTPKQNQEHAVHTGLAPMPPGAGVLTADDVLAIKSRLQLGESGVSIAKSFGVTKGCIYSIAQKRSWAWL
jgi:hypothetical protein